MALTPGNPEHPGTPVSGKPITEVGPPDAGYDLLLRALLARDALVALQAVATGATVLRKLPDGRTVIHRDRRGSKRKDADQQADAKKRP